MMNAVRALTEIRVCCAEKRSISPALQSWLAEALGNFLDQKCDDLDEAFGLRKERGGVPWWLERGITVRDQALRKLADEFLCAQGLSSQAKTIAAMAHRYETTSWPRDSNLPDMPGHYAGTARQHLWHAFRSGARMPLSARHLRNVLQSSCSIGSRAEGSESCAA